MKIAAIEEKVKKLLAENIGLENDEIDNNDSLVDDLQMSSSDIADFMHTLKENDFPTDELDFTKISTVQDLIDSLASEIEL